MLKCISLSLFVLFITIQCTTPIKATNSNQNQFEQELKYWNKVISAIIQVESKGDSLACSPSGKYIGAMQIAKILVDDCNEYAKMKKYNLNYTYDDRYSLNKSKEMFILIQRRYNKNKNIHKAIKIWNGGCHYKPNDPKVIRYYNKVMLIYNKLK